MDGDLTAPLLWSRGLMADVLLGTSRVPDTLAMSHLDRTSISFAAAAELAAVNMRTKYPDMLHDYHFVPYSRRRNTRTVV